jgi:hypothetical protein
LELLQLLTAEFLITVTTSDVWLSIGLGLLFGSACWALGTWLARTVGLLRANAPAGETLAVGLAVGLMVLAAWWAAIWSGGRSSFTPVAVGFALAVVLALVARSPRSSARPGKRASDEAEKHTSAARARASRPVTLLAAGAFVVTIGLLYGSTMAPSPRDGVQPFEFSDEAFYAVLGRDLATSGTETNLSASGFTDLTDVPVQTWYHWAELWLASAIITVFGTAPVAARYFVVLPLVLLAAAALTGTIVRRLAGTNSRRAYVFGVAVCLFLAPVPLIEGPFFASWAVGMVFGITVYGLGAVAALLALYCVSLLRRRSVNWTAAIFVGSVVAFMIPAHLAIALLAFGGLATVWLLRIGRSVLARRDIRVLVPGWYRVSIAAGSLILATIVWGIATGHGVGVSGTPIVSPFSDSWRQSIAIVAMGAGVFFAIPIALLAGRRRWSIEQDLYLGTIALLVGGAIGWGARLGEFTMFYLFFAGIAVFAMPVAAIAVQSLWQRWRATRRTKWATALTLLCFLQLELGVPTSVIRLEAFARQHDVDPIAVSLLETIGDLPATAKLAYSCEPFGETGFAVPQLLAIDAHTSRRMVPMCFEAELLSTLIGAEPSDQVPNLAFRWAPQSQLYPLPGSRPSSAAVAFFLKEHGIEYIFVDRTHPNTLVDDAVLVASSGDTLLLRLPVKPSVARTRPAATLRPMVVNRHSGGAGAS